MKKRNELLKKIIKLYDKCYEGTPIPIAIMMILVAIEMVVGCVKGFNAAVEAKEGIILTILSIIVNASIRMIIISVVCIIILFLLEVLMQDLKTKIKEEDKKSSSK